MVADNKRGRSGCVPFFCHAVDSIERARQLIRDAIQVERRNIGITHHQQMGCRNGRGDRRGHFIERTGCDDDFVASIAKLDRDVGGGTRYSIQIP